MSRAEATCCRVLVVDDEPAIRRLIRAILAPDYVVGEAAHGDEALDRAAALRPDIVLLDIQMPGKDGCRICREFKTATDNPPQIVMVSARSAPEEQLKAFEAGADDYLVKPFDTDRLFKKIDKVLKA